MTCLKKKTSATIFVLRRIRRRRRAGYVAAQPLVLFLRSARSHPSSIENSWPHVALAGHAVPSSHVLHWRRFSGGVACAKRRRTRPFVCRCGHSCVRCQTVPYRVVKTTGSAAGGGGSPAGSSVTGAASGGGGTGAAASRRLCSVATASASALSSLSDRSRMPAMTPRTIDDVPRHLGVLRERQDV